MRIRIICHRPLFSILSIVFLTTIVLHPAWGISIRNVSHNKIAFNPAENDKVEIRFSLDEPGFVTAFIFDSREILLTKVFTEGLVSGNNLHLTWDGRDQLGRIVPNEAYHYTLIAYSENGKSIEYDITDSTGGKPLNVKNVKWDKKNHQIRYFLPSTARVMIRIGLKNRGPLMNSFLNWVPMRSGIHNTLWDGYDKSGVVDLSEHSNLDIGVLAFSLSDNTILVEGAAQNTGLIQSIPWKTTKRIKKKSIRKQMFNHSQQTVEQRGDFPIIFTLPKQTRQTKEGIPIVNEKVALKLDLRPEDQQRLFTQRFESVLYLDGKFIEESELGSIPTTWYWEPKNINPGIHYLTANIRSYEGNFGVSTVKVLFKPK